MKTCPHCGAQLPDGMDCQDLFDHVLSEEYMTLSWHRDHLAAQKLASANYIIQHPHGQTSRQLAFAAQMLEMVIRDGIFPVEAAETIQQEFARKPPIFDEGWLRRGVMEYALNIANFRSPDEPFLDSAYRWSRVIFNELICA